MSAYALSNYTELSSAIIVTFTPVFSKFQSNQLLLKKYHMNCYNIFKNMSKHGEITMDIQILQYFLAVARKENITKAAESLNMTQPPLSRQLKQSAAFNYFSASIFPKPV